MPLPTQDYYLEATYADGFVYKGTREDVSSFDSGRNCFYDVEQKLLEPEHGKLTNWAVVGTQGARYDLDMTLLPDNARVILYRDLERDYEVANADDSILSQGDVRVMRTVFGAQWNDEDGQNHQLKEELE
jgi:hypothetical protein